MLSLRRAVCRCHAVPCEPICAALLPHIRSCSPPRGDGGPFRLMVWQRLFNQSHRSLTYLCWVPDFRSHGSILSGFGPPGIPGHSVRSPLGCVSLDAMCWHTKLGYSTHSFGACRHERMPSACQFHLPIDFLYVVRLPPRRLSIHSMPRHFASQVAKGNACA